MDVVTWCSSQFDKLLQLSRIGGTRVQSVQLFFALSVLSFSVFLPNSSVRFIPRSMHTCDALASKSLASSLSQPVAALQSTST